MKNFLQIGSVDPLPLLNAIATQSELWNEFNIRTTYEIGEYKSPHREASDILLWFNSLDDISDKLIDDPEVIEFPAWKKLPQVRPLIFDLMRRVEATHLGRVMITRLDPGKRIYPHPDMGKVVEYYSRYHIILQNNPGSIFRCGDEEVYMKSGECWYFNNKLVHEVVNNSTDCRLTMIVDLHLA